mmetsp:Transcript_2439/g.8751  ORF Transcript_2439/g.8751 Transcript_2439/m.8751 type:complete len:327 (+) Transcript_2439:100-1080(+)
MVATASIAVPSAATVRFQRTRASTPRAVRSVVRASALTDELNSKYGIEGSVSFSDGKGDLPMVTLSHVSGATAEVYLFGGCVTSWVVDGEDQLYVRPDAKFNGEKPISGGIPHCFPQFGPGEIQQHGFARNVNWEVAAASADVNPDDPEPCLELTLTDSDYSRSMWDKPVTVAYQVTLKKDALVCDYRVMNTGDDPFDFTAALHTYFSAAGAASVKVKGLKGLSYLDKVVDANDPPSKTEERDDVVIEGPVDSVYIGSGDEVTLETAKTKVDIQSSGWSDTVVWNPWTEMPACYDEFVCVEAAQAKDPVTLGPGESWLASMTLIAN